MIIFYISAIQPFVMLQHKNPIRRNSVLTHIIAKKHASREVLSCYKKILYKENCGTITEHKQNIRLLKEI